MSLLNTVFSRRCAAVFWVLAALCAVPVVGAAKDRFGLTETSDFYEVNTGAGLVFRVRRVDRGSKTQSPGDLMSLMYKGVEYQNQQRGSQVNSGFDWLGYSDTSVAVSAEEVGRHTVKITVSTEHLIHYYLVHEGIAAIYMGTWFDVQPVTGGGLCRYIVRIPSHLLPFGIPAADIRNNTGAIEASDVFGFDDGTTRSKHYSNMRLKDWQYFGATNHDKKPTVGVWMVRDNNEGGSGGPFYRSLINQCGSDQELTYIVNYGEAQTEPFRSGILNQYALVFTDGEPPSEEQDVEWIEPLDLVGYMPNDERGRVGCRDVGGLNADFEYTVGFSNDQAQYWAEIRDGRFGCVGMRPGIYKMQVYKNELSVYVQDGVEVTRRGTTLVDPFEIIDDPGFADALWRIGVWDGAPGEFLFGDKITTMHPGDARITDGREFEAWNPGPYVIGSSKPETGFPCYQWKDVNGALVVQFELKENQLQDSTVRVGITTAYSGGRPNISVNDWSNHRLPGPSDQPHSRTLTVGTYRGNNTTYTFAVPAGALRAGENTLTLTPISGSGMDGYLSAGYSFDCIEMVQGGP